MVKSFIRPFICHLFHFIEFNFLFNAFLFPLDELQNRRISSLKYSLVKVRSANWFYRVKYLSSTVKKAV